ncbi:MAG: hypothetical protein INR71_12430 [Terriglobus roseus]|nr:hypothetical protein [Terriglobus roseus]
MSGCLNKIPNLRPTYAMLLQHIWLAELLKPAPIAEEDEEEAAANGASHPTSTSTAATDPGAFGSEDCPGDVVDRVVADWVKNALERRRLGKLKRGEKPALHAAPLDVVASPEKESVAEVTTTMAAATLAG